MKIQLLVRQSSGPSYSWEHSGPIVRIGRNPACDLPFPGDKTQMVSWDHARLEMGPNGLFVHDLRSSNGTYVNGHAITGPLCLQPGDQVTLGQTGPRLDVVAYYAEPGSESPRPARAAIGAGPPPRQQVLATPAAAPIAAVQGNGRPLTASIHSDRSLAGRHPGSMTTFLAAFQSRSRKIWALVAVAALCFAALVVIVFVILHNQNRETAGQIADSREDLRKAQEDARRKAEEIAQIRKAAAIADEKARVAAETVRQAGAEAKRAHEKARLAEEEAKKAKEEARRAREQSPLSGQEIYRRSLRSTAFVSVRLKNGTQGNGTGSLVDKKRRLVLTAFHVVDNVSEVRVFFPAFDAQEKVISDRGFYNQRAARLVIAGRVISRNAKADLALIQLASLPDGVLELPLAETSASPGSRVHTVGNPGASAGLWAYTVGAVKQVARKQYMFATRQMIDAFVVETQNPINKGDSGGPVVNDKVELVAVNSGGGPNIREGTLCIDIREVKALLGTLE